jgi:UDP-N-acetylmuramate: L-alanyl-gamma-D-glutamyl-meso-diaminopimelate ligase
MEAILDAGAAYTSGPQWLADHVLQGRHVLAVAGTHGKTTTTSMLAWILDQAGLQPGFLVGGVPLNFGVSARLGAARGFVIEADEYDTAFFDKRSKFVHYRPRTAILNNLEFDHADIFPGPGRHRDPVPPPGAHRAGQRPPGGQCPRGGAAARAGSAAAGATCSASARGKEEPGALRARGEPHAFDVLRGSMKIARVDWRCWASTTSSTRWRRSPRPSMWAWPPEQAAAALASFQRAPPPGTARRGRRREGLRRLRPPPHGDAHHAGTGYSPQGRLARILAVFEPRSNTMKLGTMKAQLPWALEEADLSFCLQGDYGWSAARRWRRWATPPWWPTRSTLVPPSSRRRPGDHVLCMSNGGFGGIHDKLLAALGPSVDGGLRERRAACPPPRRRTCCTCTASARRRSRPSAAFCTLAAAHRPDVLVVPATATVAALGHGVAGAQGMTAGWPPRAIRGARQLAGRLLCHRRGRRPRLPAVLLNPAVDPARDLLGHVGEQTAFHDPAEHFVFRPLRRRTARHDPGHLTSARALRCRHRQGRRRAGLARDVRALRRLHHCGCSKAATMACRTSTNTSRHPPLPAPDP